MLTHTVISLVSYTQRKDEGDMVKVIKVQHKIRKAYLYHLWLLNITVMKHLNRSFTSQMLPMTLCIPAGGENPHCAVLIVYVLE